MINQHQDLIEAEVVSETEKIGISKMGSEDLRDSAKAQEKTGALMRTHLLNSGKGEKVDLEGEMEKVVLVSEAVAVVVEEAEAVVKAEVDLDLVADSVEALVVTAGASLIVIVGMIGPVV